MIDEVIVISFHHPTVKRVKQLDSRLSTGILFTGRLVDMVGAARAALADSVRPKWEYWTPAAVKEVHAAGLTASAWNADDESLIEHVVNLGVDSIGANYPDRLRAYLDRHGLDHDRRPGTDSAEHQLRAERSAWLGLDAVGHRHHCPAAG